MGSAQSVMPAAQDAIGAAQTSPRKVVVVGLSKTGTTTLGSMLRVLGYRVCGPRKALMRDVQSGNLAAVDPLLDAYTAFQDWPWPLTYRHVWSRHGKDAKFILTTRISTEKWLRSVREHGYGSDILKPMHGYGYYRPFGREEEFCGIYERHNEEVRAFFRDHPEHFIEFCLERGDGWDKLCRFLRHPQPESAVPHRNRSDASKKPINQALNRAIEPLYRSFCALSRKIAG